MFGFFSKLPFNITLKLKQATVSLCCITWFVFTHLVIFCGFVLMQVCKAFLFLELQSTLHVEHCLEILWMKGNGRIGLRQHLFFSSLIQILPFFAH